jgi:hypothetical protein
MASREHPEREPKRRTGSDAIIQLMDVLIISPDIQFMDVLIASPDDERG